MNDYSYQAQVPEQVPRQEPDEDLPHWQAQYPCIPKYPQPAGRDWKYVTITETLLIIFFVSWVAFVTLPTVLAVLVVVGTTGLSLIIDTLIFARLI